MLWWELSLGQQKFNGYNYGLKRRPKDVEYQDGGRQIQNSDLWCALEAINSFEYESFGAS